MNFSKWLFKGESIVIEWLNRLKTGDYSNSALQNIIVNQLLYCCCFTLTLLYSWIFNTHSSVSGICPFNSELWRILNMALEARSLYLGVFSGFSSCGIFTLLNSCTSKISSVPWEVLTAKVSLYRLLLLLLFFMIQLHHLQATCVHNTLDLWTKTYFLMYFYFFNSPHV